MFPATEAISAVRKNRNLKEIPAPKMVFDFYRKCHRMTGQNLIQGIMSPEGQMKFASPLFIVGVTNRC